MKQEIETQRGKEEGMEGWRDRERKERKYP